MDDRERILRLVEAKDPETMSLLAERLERITLPKPGPSGRLDGWYVIRIELPHGRGIVCDPPPGRDVLISPQHTFRQLAETINAAFARWDLGHLYAFRMADGVGIGIPDDELPYRDAARSKLARREEGEVFEYEFDFGDGWTHRCTVIEVGVDPEDVYGVRPKGPVVTWGWGSIPDQYGRTTPDG